MPSANQNKLDNLLTDSPSARLVESVGTVEETIAKLVEDCNGNDEDNKRRRQRFPIFFSMDLMPLNVRAQPDEHASLVVMARIYQ
jgi:hypothetical protein